MFIKVCGLKTKEQIDKAIEYGYDAIGIVTYHKSKRYCEPKKAMELAKYAKGKIKSFVVGITYDDVKEVSDIFDYTQIYEIQDIPNFVLASKEKPPIDLNYEYFVYDASIGSGIFKEFSECLKKNKKNILIAGGLNKENVLSVIEDIQPFGIDISSGVEKDGEKSLKMMKEFIEMVQHREKRQ